MYREWKKIEFPKGIFKSFNINNLSVCTSWCTDQVPKGYYVWISEQEDWEADQEIHGKMKWETMGEAPENSKELLYSAHANGMNEETYFWLQIASKKVTYPNLVA